MLHYVTISAIFVPLITECYKYNIYYFNFIDMEKTIQNSKMKDPPIEVLYSVTRVAKMLGMGRATIKRKITSGYITATKDGKISETSLKKYINGQ